MQNSQTNYGLEEAGMAQMDDSIGALMKHLDDMGGEPSKQFHRHLSAMQAANLAATSGHASNDKRSADISSLDNLRIKSLRPSIIRWRMNDT